MKGCHRCGPPRAETLQLITAVAQVQPCAPPPWGTCSGMGVAMSGLSPGAGSGPACGSPHERLRGWGSAPSRGGGGCGELGVWMRPPQHRSALAHCGCPWVGHPTLSHPILVPEPPHSPCPEPPTAEGQPAPAPQAPQPLPATSQLPPHQLTAEANEPGWGGQEGRSEGAGAEG